MYKAPTPNSLVFFKEPNYQQISTIVIKCSRTLTIDHWPVSVSVTYLQNICWCLKVGYVVVALAGSGLWSDLQSWCFATLCFAGIQTTIYHLQTIYTEMHIKYISLSTRQIIYLIIIPGNISSRIFVQLKFIHWSM